LDQACPLLLQDLAANLIFITTILGIAYIYMRIRHKTHTTFQKQLGLGDILYFVAVAPWFSPIQFILFFISGILLTLIAIVIFLALRKIPKDWPIPLAGVLAAYWLLFLPFAEILEVLVLKKFGI
ncbi:MAG TPA: hypothetical protein VHS96_07850, partial [Bacteroidia bacterium]|nr:hypothetical protein [Bacteroidia bacterium]